MTTKITVVGIDAAFANMGFATATLTIGPTEVLIDCVALNLVTTEGQNKKQVRKSSDSLRRAKELHAALQAFCSYATFVFAEVPTGSQSASAASSLGIAVGILASCRAPIIEVSPMEVKRAVIPNSKVNPSKAYVIDWAVKRWPTAPWLRDRGKPNGRILNSNEHLADAMATIVAGVETPEFKNVVQMMRQQPTRRRTLNE